jgi:hypothetical protein
MHLNSEYSFLVILCIVDFVLLWLNLHPFAALNFRCAILENSAVTGMLIFRCGWRKCLHGVLMFVRDRQTLGVFASVSELQCIASRIHSEACRLGYRPAGRHVERSVTTLFSGSFRCMIYITQLFKLKSSMAFSWNIWRRRHSHYTFHIQNQFVIIRPTLRKPLAYRKNNLHGKHRF